MTLRMLTYQNINSSERAEYAPYYHTSVGVAFSILSLLGKKDISCLSLMFVCFPGTVGNSLTLVVVGRTRRLYNHCTPLLSSLAVANLLGCVSSLPVISHNALTSSQANIFTSALTCKLLSMELHALFGISFGIKFRKNFGYFNPVICLLIPATVAAISVVQSIVVWTNGSSKLLNK